MWINNPPVVWCFFLTPLKSSFKVKLTSKKLVWKLHTLALLDVYLLKRWPWRFPFFMYSYTRICTRRVKSFDKDLRTPKQKTWVVPNIYVLVLTVQLSFYFLQFVWIENCIGKNFQWGSFKRPTNLQFCLLKPNLGCMDGWMGGCIIGREKLHAWRRFSSQNPSSRTKFLWCNLLSSSTCHKSVSIAVCKCWTKCMSSF